MSLLPSLAAALVPPDLQPPPTTTSSYPDIDDGQAIYEAWLAIDFATVQTAMEQQAKTIVDERESIVQHRKHVSLQTKEFRAGKLMVNDLIKSYQEHVEQVTAHAKFNGDAFLTVFRILSTVSDPCNAIEQALRQEKEIASKLRAVEEQRGKEVLSKSKESRLKEEKAEREKWKESLTLDGEAKLSLAITNMEERALKAQEQYDSELARMQGEMDRLVAENADLMRDRVTGGGTSSTTPSVMDSSTSHHIIDENDLIQARAEGERTANETWSLKLDRITKDNTAAFAVLEERVAELSSQCTSHLETIAQLKAQTSTHDVHALKAQVTKLQSDVMVMSKLLREHNPDVVVDDSHLATTSLEAWLLAANQRLTQDLDEARRKLSMLESPVLPVTAVSTISAMTTNAATTTTNKNDDGTELDDASMRLRNKLRAALERKDLQIEELQRHLEDKDVAQQRMEEECTRLKQRVRFLQSYKTSERSTLIVGSGGGATAPLGRGVEHQFRALWESDLPGGLPSGSSSASSGKHFTWPERVVFNISGSLLTRKRGRLFTFAYILVLHMGILWCMIGIH